MSSSTSWLQTLLPKEEESNSISQIDSSEEIWALDNETIICFDIQGNKIGCVVFNFEYAQLSIMPSDLDIQNNEYMIILGERNSKKHSLELLLNRILRQFDVTHVLISSRFNNEMYRTILSYCTDVGLKFKTASTRYFKSNEDIIAKLQDSGERSFKAWLLEADKYSNITVRALIGLFWWDAEVNQGRKQMNTGLEIPKFEKLSFINLDGMVYVDYLTLSALRILQPLVKPYANIENCDAAFSLVELFTNVKSKIGKKLLKNWLKLPINEMDELVERIQTTELILYPENYSCFIEIIHILNNLPDVKNSFTKLDEDIFASSAWLGIYNFLRHSVTIISRIRRIDKKIESQLITKLQNIEIASLVDTIDYLNSVINYNKLLTDKEVEIVENINFEYDQFKKVYTRLEATLKTIVDDIIEELLSDSKNRLDHLNSAEELNALYIPQLGFLVTIENTRVHYWGEVWGSLNWQLVFKDNSHHYYKNSMVTSLDDEFGDLMTKIFELKLEILANVRENLVKHRSLLIDISEFFGRLEVLISFAILANERNYCKPILKKDKSVVKITQGRHPLLETLSDNFIPNDIILDGGMLKDINWFSSGRQRIAVVTGANASGKTIFLEQIALIVYMAHIGCYVPADTAEIGLVDMILTKFKSFDSISTSMSSFERDSKQLSKIMSLATKRSIIFIDEYGKGTDTISGPSLLAAIIQRYSQLPGAPRLLISTHFYEIFQKSSLLKHRGSIKFLTTKIVLNNCEVENLVTENEGIVFFYQIVEGICDSSLGIYCAKICGIKRRS
ncbi:MutS domain III [Nakaseomyces glabratus]